LISLRLRCIVDELENVHWQDYTSEH
jgi:hypothetical protein